MFSVSSNDKMLDDKAMLKQYRSTINVTRSALHINHLLLSYMMYRNCELESRSCPRVQRSQELVWVGELCATFAPTVWPHLLATTWTILWWVGELNSVFNLFAALEFYLFYPFVLKGLDWTAWCRKLLYGLGLTAKPAEWERKGVKNGLVCKWNSWLMWS